MTSRTFPVRLSFILKLLGLEYFKKLGNYIWSLKFEQDPDYDKMLRYMNKYILENTWSIDGVYDWTLIGSQPQDSRIRS
jgi:hypothetical protein